MEYEVTITRTFVQQATVKVEAEDELEAQYLAEERYYDGDYAMDFVEDEGATQVEFDAEEC